MIQLLLGNFTFLDPEIDGQHKCIIHHIDEVVECRPEEATAKGEDMLNTFEAYLIPILYKGEIVWDNEISDVQDGWEMCPSCRTFVSNEEMNSDTGLCNDCHEDTIPKCWFCGDEIEEGYFCSQDCAEGYRQDN